MREFSSAILEFIRAHVPEEDIMENEPMSKHTTFRIGGEAACFVKISSIEQLQKLVPYFKQVEVPYFILGNGSNLLVGDRGYDGVILQIKEKFNRIEVEGALIRAQAGALLSQVAQCALEHSLADFAFASGIPGTVGGGVMMNAGAYGGEMKQVVEEVTVLDENGEMLVLDNATMEFGYRTSIIKNRHFTVLEVTFRLSEGNREEIRREMDELAAKRREKQPLNFPSAGSTFKRPEGYYAGKLIMDAGLRGYSIGGAGVSEKHCGFVVNKGNATAEDVFEVIEEVRERVKDKFGVTLECEVIRLGNF